MDAPEGSFALIGEGRTKSSLDRIRKERTGRARQAAPGDRRAFVNALSRYFFLSSTGTKEFLQKKVKKRWSRRRDALCCLFSWVCWRKVSRIHPRLAFI